jgi:hypothetical protein
MVLLARHERCGETPSEDPGHVLIQKITRIRGQLAREQGQNDPGRARLIRGLIRGG